MAVVVVWWCLNLTPLKVSENQHCLDNQCWLGMLT